MFTSKRTGWTKFYLCYFAKCLVKTDDFTIHRQWKYQEIRAAFHSKLFREFCSIVCMISLQKSDWFTIELSREIIAKSLLRRIQLYQSNNNYNVAIIIEWTNHCIPIKPSSSTYCFDFNTFLLPRFLGWFAAMDDSSDVFIMIGDDDFFSDVS